MSKGPHQCCSTEYDAAVPECRCVVQDHHYYYYYCAKYCSRTAAVVVRSKLHTYLVPLLLLPSLYRQTVRTSLWASQRRLLPGKSSPRGRASPRARRHRGSPDRALRESGSWPSPRRAPCKQIDRSIHRSRKDECIIMYIRKTVRCQWVVRATAATISPMLMLTAVAVGNRALETLPPAVRWVKEAHTQAQQKRVKKKV